MQIVKNLIWGGLAVVAIFFFILAVAQFYAFVKSVGAEEYTGDAQREYERVEIINQDGGPPLIIYHKIYEWDE